MQHIPAPLRLSDAARRDIRLLFMAKHALGDGSLDCEDGNHAVYHHEVRTMLEGLFDHVVLANRYDILFERPEVDYVFPLLNRGGFVNSEMMVPLLCNRLDLPFLGASPILRGLSDDKHLSKRAAQVHGIPTADWAIYRYGAEVREADCPKGDRMVIKPNASSASWGVHDANDWAGVRKAIAEIHTEGHDAIVEPFLNGSDVEVPVITIDGKPVVMPMMLFQQADPSHLRTYWEKRDLVERASKYELIDFEGGPIADKIGGYTRELAREFMPFDYGRYEFRVDFDTGKVDFLEVNLNCNLWSQKVFGRSVLRAGWSQQQLVETIVVEGLTRHGLAKPA